MKNIYYFKLFTYINYQWQGRVLIVINVQTGAFQPDYEKQEINCTL